MSVINLKEIMYIMDHPLTEELSELIIYRGDTTYHKKELARILKEVAVMQQNYDLATKLRDFHNGGGSLYKRLVTDKENMNSRTTT